MHGQQKIQVTYFTSKEDLSIAATASYPNGQPFSPYTLSTQVTHPDQFPAAQSLLQYIFLTAHDKQIELNAELSIQYGFWIVKLKLGNHHQLEIFELDEQSQFVPGVERALRYWKTQVQLCQAHQLPFQPVHLQQIAIVNRKIFDPTKPVLGIRNLRREDQSGWVILSSEEDLWDHENAENHYLYDLILRRPELVHFFGLPMDTVFYLDKEGYRVWSIAEED